MYLRELPLNSNDWREVFWFMKQVYLPFIHRIAARALARRKAETKEIENATTE